MSAQKDSELTADRSSAHWLISGRVQGVGFRYHVLLAAHRLGVTGDVRNLPDGRVEIRAQGPRDRLDGLLATVRSGPPGARVDAVESSEFDSRERFDTFAIR